MTIQDFCLRLSGPCAVSAGMHVLAAVSGGADSTALLCFLCEARGRMGITVSCAHVEHGIRSQASLDDMAFVQRLCAQMNVPLYVSRVDAPALAEKMHTGMEDAARALRYDFLYKTAEEIGADVIALAHHRDDQAETVLLHAARGSDMRGLCAMRMRRANLIRPLLDVPRQELRAYLEAVDQPFCEDETNKDTDYTRNRIRHLVMPQLEAACPGAGAALSRLADAAQRDEAYFVQQLDGLGIRMRPLVNGAALEREQIELLHPALLSRLLVRTAEQAHIAPQSARVIGAVMTALAGNEEAAVNLTGGAHAILGKRYLCLVQGDARASDTPLRTQGETDTPFGRFRVRDAEPDEHGDGIKAQAIPARLLSGAVIGGRREGDTLIPFGRHAPVKLKKLMIDAGIERAMRDSVPVLRSREGILWAAGLRPSQLCRAEKNEPRKLVEFFGA